MFERCKEPSGIFMKQIIPDVFNDLLQKMIQPINKLTLELFHKTSRSVFSSEYEENIYGHFMQKKCHCNAIESETFAMAVLFHTKSDENLPFLKILETAEPPSYKFYKNTKFNSWYFG